MSRFNKKVVRLKQKTRTALRGSQEDETQKLRDQLAIYQTHITNLEHDLKQKKGIVYQPDETDGRIRFVANQLDPTGAPLVFMDLMRDFMAHKKGNQAQPVLHTFLPAQQKYVDQLERLGMKVIVHEKRNIEVQWGKGDTVVLNTSAYEPVFRQSIYNALENDTVKKLIWYVHEDWPEVFFTDEERARLKDLLTRDKVVIFIPAAKALKNYQNFFGTQKNLSKLPYRLNVDAQYYSARQAADFDKLVFTLVGKTGEGLKGHLPILYALIDFQNTYYKKTPELYRDFELHFIALQEDYISLQIKRHAGALGRHFKQSPPLDHAETLKRIQAGNITVCYSLRECLPVFVYEGMIMGHPILRNDVSGAEEQLKAGINGLSLDSNDFQQVVETFETILNVRKTPDSVLEKMSKRSYEIALQATKNSYDPIINALRN